MLGIAVVIAVAAFAVPLGVLRALFQVPMAALWDFLFLVPFLIPPYIATLGWILSLQPGGYLSQLTGANGGPFLFSFAGIVFVMAFNVFPAVYFAVSRTVAAVGGRYSDVARVFGASPWTALRRVTLPLALPGIAASLLLVFAMTIEEFGTPAALGRRSGFAVLVTGIENKLADWPIDLPGAATLSVILVVLALGAYLIQLGILARRNYETTGSRPQATVRRPLGRWSMPVSLLFSLAALFGTVIPVAAIVATALSRTISGGLAPGNLGLQNFAKILADESGARDAMFTSLSLGIATALVTGILGAVASYGIVKTRFRGRTALDALTILPNAIPGVVLAVGLILAWNQPALPITPYNTWLILLMAYCCLLLPFPVRYANAALRQIGDSLEPAARVAGASPLTSFRRIVLPLILPSLLSAMLLVFAVASRELVASILVAPVGMQTIASFIWQQFEQGSVQLGMAMSAVAILITALIPLAVMLVARRFLPGLMIEG
jgi:iron(III) transport system permease protein